MPPKRYWSHAAIGCIHRMMAVEEWKKIKAGTPSDPNFAYELILASFDMFILEERNVGDTSDVSLSKIAFIPPKCPFINCPRSLSIHLLLSPPK